MAANCSMGNVTMTGLPNNTPTAATGSLLSEQVTLLVAEVRSGKRSTQSARTQLGVLFNHLACWQKNLESVPVAAKTLHWLNMQSSLLMGIALYRLALRLLHAWLLQCETERLAGESIASARAGDKLLLCLHARL